MRRDAMMPPWTWDAVTQDCHGQPEAAVVYIVSQVVKEPDGFMSLVREDVTLLLTFPQADTYVPPLGGVTFIDVEARDEAGNVSGGVCP